MSERLKSANAATTTLRLVQSFRGDMFCRITLRCPEGHEVVDSPIDSPTGQRLARGDYSGERCGYGSCGWSA